MKSMQTRRNVLINTIKNGLGVVAATTVAPFLLPSCKRNENKETALAKEERVDVIQCANQDALSKEEKTIRDSLKYVDNTPVHGRTCDNCKLYTLPKKQTECGGCKIVPGPIHPQGYCTAWLHRM